MTADNSEEKKPSPLNQDKKGTPEEEQLLAGYHKTISEQLNARLSESPKFFGVLVITSTAFGFVTWNLRKEGNLVVFGLSSLVAYLAVLWSLWYLAALGYAFRFLQYSQHRIEDKLGWAMYRPEKTGYPPDCITSISKLFWLLPGIYHAHAAGLISLLAIVIGVYWVEWPNKCIATVFTLVALIFACVAIIWMNLHYIRKFRKVYKEYK